MNLSNEIKTGLLFIFGIILFIIGFSYLKSNDVFSADRKFFGIYDNTEGVVPGTPVTINGFQVGSVESIELLNPSAKILVTFRIENKFNFSRNSTAQIYESGLIGGKLLGIIPANDNAVNAKKGDTLKTSVAPGLTDLVNEKLSPLQEKIESMIVHADSLLISFNNILDYDRIDKIKSSIDDVNIILNNLSLITLTIDEAINSKNGKINKSLESFSLASENIKNITKMNNDLGQLVKIQLHLRVELPEELWKNNTDFIEIKNLAKSLFRSISFFKPNSSRSDSKETYLHCKFLKTL